MHHLGDPELAWSPADRPSLPGPVAMWASLLVTQLVLVGLVVVTVRLVRSLRVSGKRHGGPARASRSDVERRMGRKSVDRHTAALYGKDAVCGREPLALGIDVATGARLFAKSEDYILAVGVPRVGKGEGFVIPAVLRHKGPAVVTATRHDTYMDTGRVRARVGPVSVFDPQGLVPDAEKLRWNPVKGCEVPQTAILRARGFAGFAGVGPALDGGGAYWEQVAASVIRSYLHAAALEGLGVEQLLDWSRRPAAREPIRILSRHPGAARGWDEDLATSAEVEPRHRDSIWATVRRAFDCFADPMVLEATRVDHDTFDPGEFLGPTRDDLPDGLTGRAALGRPDRRRPHRRRRRHGAPPSGGVPDAPARVAPGPHARRVRQHRPARRPPQARRRAGGPRDHHRGDPPVGGLRPHHLGRGRRTGAA